MNTHYLQLGFALVPVYAKQKRPIGNNWQNHPVKKQEDLARLEHKNVGLHHKQSKTIILDIDHLHLTGKALASIGINLKKLFTAQGPKIISKNSVKPLYLLPAGLEPAIKQLKFISPQNRQESITVFELRAKGQDLLPPSVHPDGHIYKWKEEPKQRVDIPVLPKPLQALLKHWHELEPLMQEVSPWYMPPKLKIPESKDSVIDQFNQIVTIQSVLERNNYKPKGRRYLAPSSKTGIPGVSVFNERCYSHHASDLLADGHAHDSFDVLRLLECNGDFKKALDKARAELRLEPFRPRKDSKAKPKKQAKSKERKPNLVFMDTVDAEEVQFLWHPYIPLGKLTLLEGDPGLGKTFIALTLCSIVSNGYAFPTIEANGFGSAKKLEPSNVIFLTAEDGLADTLKPRLVAAKADCSRVAVLKGFTEVYEEQEVLRAFTLADVDMLDKALEITKAKLVVIDPLQGFLGSKVDMHRANEVRPLLSEVGRLAEQHQCAVVGIRHLSKSNKSGALHRGLGSVDFTAFARSQLLVGEHNGQRLIGHSKSSLAPEGKSLIYNIQDGQLVWLGSSDLSPEDISNPVIESNTLEDKLEQAKKIIRYALDEVPTPSKVIFSEAAQLGISKRTIERAKKELGNIAATPLRLASDPRKNVWHWHYDIQVISVNELGEIEIDGSSIDRSNKISLRDKSLAEMAEMEENLSGTEKLECQSRPPHGGDDGNVENAVQDDKTAKSAKTALRNTLGALQKNKSLSFEEL